MAHFIGLAHPLGGSSFVMGCIRCAAAAPEIVVVVVVAVVPSSFTSALMLLRNEFVLPKLSQKTTVSRFSFRFF